MHMAIGILVQAEDENQAKNLAQDSLEELCGSAKPFDYFSFYDDDADEGVYRTNSVTGKKWIAKLLEWTKQEFMDNLARVRVVIDKFDDEHIWEHGSDIGGDTDMFRHRCHKLGEYAGSAIRLYEGPSGIRDSKSLNSVLSRPQPPGESLWIVVADVHV